MADDVIQGMIIKFMEEQNKFNLQIIERLSKAEIRIYLVMSVISGAIAILSKYFLP